MSEDRPPPADEPCSFGTGNPARLCVVSAKQGRSFTVSVRSLGRPAFAARNCFGGVGKEERRRTRNVTNERLFSMDVKFFDNKIEKFLNTLNPETTARALRTIDLLEAFGHELGFPHSKKVESRLFELRIRGRQEVRLLYTFHQDAAVVLHGFIKKSERTPLREIEVARRKLKALDTQ